MRKHTWCAICADAFDRKVAVDDDIAAMRRECSTTAPLAVDWLELIWQQNQYQPQPPFVIVLARVSDDEKLTSIVQELE